MQALTLCVCGAAATPACPCMCMQPWEVTQVVNGNIGNNICCYKYIKDKSKVPYVPKTFPYSSRVMKGSITGGIYKK